MCLVVIPPLSTQPPEILLCPSATSVGREGMGEQPHQWGCKLSPNVWLKGCAVHREPACTPGSFVSLNNLSMASIFLPMPLLHHFPVRLTGDFHNLVFSACEVIMLSN